MKVKGIHYRSIWFNPDDEKVVQIIDQRKLPYQFEIEELRSVSDVIRAIKEMHLRGAPLIGAAAGCGMVLAAIECANSSSYNLNLDEAAHELIAARPTAVNLRWAVEKQQAAIESVQSIEGKIRIARVTASEIIQKDVECCQKIGEHGLSLFEELHKQKDGKPVNVLTHCNAGWLACVDYGTATAPIYAAFDEGINIHVWVDETRPRNQGARLTAWELHEHGVPHTVIADNTGGYLMQKGMVDIVLVGTDRTAINGDVANKIGTYLKALAAKDNNIPFYVGLPSSSIDWHSHSGLEDIPIEEREPEEVIYVEGVCDNTIQKVRITPLESTAVNYAFDITPSHLITGLITERGIAQANEKSLTAFFPEFAPK